MSQTNLGAALHKNGWIKQNKLRVISALFLLAMIFSVSLPVVAGAQPQGRRRHTNRDRRVSHSEVQETLQDIPGVMESSDQTVAQSDADSAATSTTNGTVVDVPKDAKKGVTFGAEGGPKLDIQLPNATEASEGTQVAAGTVAYESGNGSANAVQATEDGGVRMLTIIDNPSAPTAYDYKVTVPNGGRIELTPDGGAIVLAAESSEPIASVAAPWAKDAEDKTIQTWFTTDGQTLTQHVQHNIPGVVYPVVADPSVSWGWTGYNVYFSKGETNAMAWITGAAASMATGKLLGLVSFGIVPAAQWATRNGYCVAVFRSYNPNSVMVPWPYRC
ncbi:MAG TPA: hypothetical protein VK694_06545 [Verrucomicrobiae bacterium]|nr:hypothetical protein [Verrucomicrobiae bacterium]